MTTRRLAAILAADVAGYSALMERDEEGTFARIGSLRREIIEPLLSEHQGRLIKTTGDGFLVEFASPIAALRCALVIQSNLASDPVALPLRIGLNLGDVIIEESGDVYGEGVNVAARLEALADPGSILISGKVHSEVEGKVEANFEDRGEQQVKNIARPVRIYAVRSAGATRTSAATSPSQFDPGKPLPPPDKPSIAVLPFQNMSGDPEQEYFADGMVEDLITGLSRIKWLFVIARNSSFVYKGRPVDVRQVGRELGVRYVLEGGVRKAGNRLRITAQLLEAETGVHLWAEKYDGAPEDVFDLQDQITDKVIGIVEPNLRLSEIERSRRKRPNNLAAYDLYLRGLYHFQLFTPQGIKTAGGLYEDAIRLDPDYADAHAALAWCHYCRFRDRGFEEAEKIATLHHARAAIAAGASNANALAASAPLLVWLAQDYNAATSAIERAISLNASSGAAHFHGAMVYAYGGRSAIAIAHANRALRLSPFDPLASTAHEALGLAAIEEGRYDEAALHFATAVEANPSINIYRFAHASALALAGRIEEASPIAQRGLKVDPRFRVSAVFKIGMARTIAEKLAEGGRLSGLPE